jgi:HlyD family secretion protein
VFRRIAGAVLLLALATGAFVVGRRLVGSASHGSQLRAVGMIEAQEVDITSRTPGRIVELDLGEGDPVAKDQVVCRIDSTDLTNQLARAKADRTHARADLDNDERNLVRTRQLFDDGVASAQARDDAVTQVEMARAAVASAEAQVDYYEGQLRDTEIRSPIAGVVVYKALEVGEWATPGMPILVVDDLSTIWARVDVQETEIVGLHVGDAAVVALPGRPPVEIPGRIMAIGQEGEFATERDVRRGRQDIRTFAVKVRLEGDSAAAKPGMTAEVVFHRAERGEDGSGGP